MNKTCQDPVTKKCVLQKYFNFFKCESNLNITLFKGTIVSALEKQKDG